MTSLHCTVNTCTQPKMQYKDFFESSLIQLVKTYFLSIRMAIYALSEASLRELVPLEIADKRLQGLTQRIWLRYTYRPALLACHFSGSEQRFCTKRQGLSCCIVRIL